MKKIVKTLLGLFVAAFVLTVIGNNFIRVSDGTGRSIGIVEEALFGRSILGFLQPPWSENYRRWEAANEGSEKIAALIQEYGPDIIEDPELEDLRLSLVELTRRSYENASSID